MKYLGIIISVITFLLGIVLIFGVYKEKVDTVEVEIDQHEQRIAESEFINLRQTIILEEVEKKL